MIRTRPDGTIPNTVTALANCRNLGIREYVGPGDCEPIATGQTTWGRIKALQ